MHDMIQTSRKALLGVNRCPSQVNHERLHIGMPESRFANTVYADLHADLHAGGVIPYTEYFNTRFSLSPDTTNTGDASLQKKKNQSASVIDQLLIS